MTKIKMEVDGIFCPNCVKKIKQTASEVPGIAAIDVTEDFKTVNVEFDAAQIDVEGIKQMIETIPDKEFVIKQTV